MGSLFIATGVVICCFKLTGESKLLPYFDWGVTIMRLIMIGESLLRDSLLRVTPGRHFITVFSTLVLEC